MMEPPRFNLAAFERDGFAIVERVIGAAEIASLGELLGAGNARNLLGIPAVRARACSTAIRALIEPILGASAFPVRGLLFDKTAQNNWKVSWHQDLSIAVKDRIDTPGFGPWSMKAGVPHVQPPLAVLRQMATIRLHLDECGPENGPLRVLPGSHQHGVIAGDEIARLRTWIPERVCVVAAGGAVLMRPLVLHASSAAEQPGRRRVVHIEFAATGLPHPLEWFEATPSMRAVASL